MTQDESHKLGEWLSWWVLDGGPTLLLVLAILGILYGLLTADWEGPVYVATVIIGGVWVVSILGLAFGALVLSTIAKMPTE